MPKLFRFAFVGGLAAGLCALIGAFCLTILDLIAPMGSTGNVHAVEVAVRILTLLFILFGFVVFIGAIRQLVQTWAPLSIKWKCIIMGALITTSFFGSYAFLIVYPRIRSSLGECDPSSDLRGKV